MARALAWLLALATDIEIGYRRMHLAAVSAERSVSRCWACSLGRCGQGPFDQVCGCCRQGHLPG